MPQGSERAAPKPVSTEQIRRRVRLMVQISARPGVYRRGLVKTAERLTPSPARSRQRRADARRLAPGGERGRDLRLTRSGCPLPSPDRAGDLRELTFTGEVQGRGLFGASNVWITRMAARTAQELLRRDVEPPGAPPSVGSGRAETAELDGEQPIRYAARIEADQPQEEHR